MDMDQILEFVRNLDVARIAILVFAGCLALPYVFELFAFLRRPSKRKYKLTKLVDKWENLYEECKKAGLNGACDKLIEVFPFLVDKYVNPSNSKKDP